jgi:hypothetical protein
MRSGRYVYAFVLAVTIAIAAPQAHAISLTLAGSEPEGAAPATDLTSTLWASLPGGALVRIATVGADAPGGGKFTEMGVPSISPESQVIFGAEVTGADGVARWEIFRGDLTAPAGRRVVRAIDSAAASPGCVPNIKIDPYPIAGSNGAIAFIAPEANGSDALFRYANGELTCAVRIGDRTAEGDTLRMMHFGSAAMAPTGEVAFLGRISDGDAQGPGANRASRLAMLLAPQRGPVRELAVEGSRGANGSGYLAGFGLPAVVSTRGGPIVAFTAIDSNGTDSHGYRLYVSSNGKTVDVLGSGEGTSVGPLTFLSNGRPALSATGGIAVRGASADRRAIFSIRDEHLTVVVTPGGVTQVGSRIVTFGDPVVDNDDRDLLYAVEPGNLLRVSVPPVAAGELVEGLTPQIFAGTLVVNEFGAFAFIGGKN